MKFQSIILTVITFLSGQLLIAQHSYAQCGYAAGLGCSNTDYNNFGANSISFNDPTTIEYDNFVSAYHSTIIREYSGAFKAWGEKRAPNGTSNQLTPLTINTTSFTNLSGTILKAGQGSHGSGSSQAILLTTTGLFAWGDQGVVLSSGNTSSNAFQKLTINGNNTGLPIGVEPFDVKMMFVTRNSIAITTCSGDVWVISQVSRKRGNGNTGNSNIWYRVKTGSGTNDFLTNVIAVRGCPNALIALKSDGTLWTWGNSTYLGNATGATNRDYATQMELPTGANSIKMIGATQAGSSSISYYALDIDGKLFCLGNNSLRQLGTWNTTNATSWVRPKYNSASGPAMDDIIWISPNEHDANNYAAINAINSSLELHNWGANDDRLLGRGTSATVNPGIPGGLTYPTDKVLSVETGGHTSMITMKCEPNYGYVGHQINGSVGNGITSEAYINTFTFNNTANIQICGATTVPEINVVFTPTTGSNGLICSSSNMLLEGSPAGGTFTIVSGPGTITGNQLSFTGVGTVVVQYSVYVDGCPGASVTSNRSFTTENCTTYYTISGVVWNDINENAIQESTEPGTNVSNIPNKGLWINLISNADSILASQPVDIDGTYLLSVIANGTYKLQLTTGQVGVDIKASDALNPINTTLPPGWSYTGTNIDGIPNTTNLTGSISSVVVANANVYNRNFGVFDIPLPVKLLSFTATKSGNAVRLDWSTSLEQNNYGFTLQKSKDGNNWNDLGFVNSLAKNGNSNEVLNYSFTDYNPLSGKSMYRLIQTDFDGRYEYSPVRMVIFEGSNDLSQIRVYPNPVSNSLNISELAGGEKITITDVLGRIVYNSATDNGGNASVEMRNLPSGMYHLTIRDNNGIVIHFKIMKQ